MVCIRRHFFDFFFITYNVFSSFFSGILPSLQDKEKFVCEFCSKIFFSVSSLNYHQKSKHGSKQDYLKEAMLKVNKTNSHSCPHCTKTFSNR